MHEFAFHFSLVFVLCTLTDFGFPHLFHAAFGCRYWAVTNIDYIHQRTARRIGLMILVVWLVAFMVCIAPMLGWKDPGWNDRVILDQECMVSQDIVYQIFATASSFYLPLLVILVLYWRIFQTARRRIRRRVQAQTTVGGRSVPGGGPKNPAQGGVIAGTLVV